MQQPEELERSKIFGCFRSGMEWQMAMVGNLEQHNIEIHENREHWNRKPLLRQVYSELRHP